VWAKPANHVCHCVLLPTHARFFYSQHPCDQCIDVLHVAIATSPCQYDHADKLHVVEHKSSIGDPVNSVNVYVRMVM